MIRVAVCDDDPNITEYVRQYLEAKSDRLQGETLHISLYHSGADFLRNVENGIAFHIVFMDIQMDGLDGIKVGQILRKMPNGDAPAIIYISHYDTYFRDMVQLEIVGFIEKPLHEDKLDEVFGRALKRTNAYKRIVTPERFTFQSDSEFYAIPTDEIVYLKSDKRVVEIYTWNHADQSIRIAHKFYSKIDEALERLAESRFIRCERSHIVNLDYVSWPDKHAFILRDSAETAIPISRRYKQEAKKAYFRYMEGSVWVK